MPIHLLHHDGLPASHACVRRTDRVVAQGATPLRGEHGLTAPDDRRRLVGAEVSHTARVEARTRRCDGRHLNRATRRCEARGDVVRRGRHRQGVDSCERGRGERLSEFRRLVDEEGDHRLFALLGHLLGGALLLGFGGLLPEGILSGEGVLVALHALVESELRVCGDDVGGLRRDLLTPCPILAVGREILF